MPRDVVGLRRYMPTVAFQPAAPRPAADRSEPRHRARDGEALLGRGLARHHLLAPRVPGKLPVGDGAGGSHPGRSRRSRRHRRGDRRDQAAARQRRAARARQQRRDLAQGRRRQAAVVDRYHGRRLGPRVPGEFLRADHARARPDGRAARPPRARSSTSPRSRARACIRSRARPMPPRRRRWHR